MFSNDFAQCYDRWRSLMQAHTHAQDEAELIHARLSAAQAELKKCQELLAATQAHAAQHTALGSTLPECQARLCRMEAHEQQALACARLLGIMTQLQREQSVHRHAYEQAQARSSHAAAQYLQQIGYELSTQLVPDTPCPVCGSRVHPAPAAPPTETVSPELLAQYRAQAASASLTLSACEARYRALDEQFSALHAQLNDEKYDHTQLAAAQKSVQEAQYHQVYADRLKQKAIRLTCEIRQHQHTVRALEDQAQLLTQTVSHTAQGLRQLSAQLEQADPDGVLRAQLDETNPGDPAGHTS